ncbi:unnamed protein product, partial [Brassica oleracea var. botrytis]
RTIRRWHLSQCQSGALGYQSAIGAVVFIVLRCRVGHKILCNNLAAFVSKLPSSYLIIFHFANIFNPIQAVTMDEV